MFFSAPQLRVFCIVWQRRDFCRESAPLRAFQDFSGLKAFVRASQYKYMYLRENKRDTKKRRNRGLK